MNRKRIPLSVAAALRQVGQDIQLARRRRRIRQRDLAARMGVSISTLRALEAGAPGVSMGNLAMALLALGRLSRLDELADVRQDDIGLTMELEALPRRIRIRKNADGLRSGSPLTTEPSSAGALL